MKIKVEEAISNLQNQMMRFAEGIEPYIALQMAIEALSGESIKWHPYPQEIPTDVGEYLVTIDGKVTIEDATYYEYSGTYQFDSQGVTAWAELPKPYEEGAEECGL